jgi:hypothetical protein
MLIDVLRPPPVQCGSVPKSRTRSTTISGMTLPGERSLTEVIEQLDRIREELMQVQRCLENREAETLLLQDGNKRQ